jgi:hypothetical protein
MKRKTEHPFGPPRLPRCNTLPPKKRYGEMGALLSGLPDELNIHTFTFLDMTNMEAVNLTCKEWNRIGNSKAMWNMWIKSRFKLKHSDTMLGIDDVYNLLQKTCYFCAIPLPESENDIHTATFEVLAYMSKGAHKKHKYRELGVSSTDPRTSEWYICPKCSANYSLFITAQAAYRSFDIDKHKGFDRFRSVIRRGPFSTCKEYPLFIKKHVKDEWDYNQQSFKWKHVCSTKYKRSCGSKCAYPIEDNVGVCVYKRWVKHTRDGL